MWEWLDERGECPRVERCTEVQDLEEGNWNIGMGRLEYRLGGDETQFTSRTKYRSWGRLAKAVVEEWKGDVGLRWGAILVVVVD